MSGLSFGYSFDRTTRAARSDKLRAASFVLAILLLNSGGQERASRVGGVGVAVFDLSDDAVEIDVFARDNDNNVAGAVLLFVDREFDDRRVAVLVRDGVVLKGIGIETERLAE